MDNLLPVLQPPSGGFNAPSLSQRRNQLVAILVNRYTGAPPLRFHPKAPINQLGKLGLGGLAGVGCHFCKCQLEECTGLNPYG